MSDSVAKTFGKKERVLNYACQTYQLSRPSKVGEVMRLIRECQPRTFAEWENFYFERAQTAAKNPVAVTRETLVELGQRLYAKITEVVIPEWMEAFRSISEEDCVAYIFNLTLNRTYDGYWREISLIQQVFVKEFPEIIFEESDPVTDHAGDVDYVGWIEHGKVGFGLQIKPVTAQFAFAGYSPSDRMRNAFRVFEERFRGRVFVVFSIDKKLVNGEVLV